MSRSTVVAESEAAATPAPASDRRAAKAPRRKESWRESIESLTIALVLALLIRGFAAEAFVIPTGSMAPTLMGRHKEITCPECEQVYTVNASERGEEAEGATLFGLGAGSSSRDPIQFATCVNCRLTAAIGDQPAHTGDRILVSKAPYSLPWLPFAGPPDRWETVVFHWPEGPETNYIKRLVGKPGETIRIHAGDISVKSDSGDPFRLAVKPWRHLAAMRQLVHDDTKRPSSLVEFPEWRRWQATPAGGWVEPADAPATYRAALTTEAPVELAYQHLIPIPAQWRDLQAGIAPREAPRPTLITDYNSYNTAQSGRSSSDEASWFHPHWVGDLILSARIRYESPQPGSWLALTLVRAGKSSHATLDLTSRTARLAHDGVELGPPIPIDLQPGSDHDLILTNVDGRLNLRVNGSMPFGEGLIYREGDDGGPTAADLRPATIACKGVAVTASRLKLERDLYYTQTPGRESDYDANWDRAPRTASELFDLLGDPARFELLADTPASEYPIQPGHYLMLGDNSPRSSDSRAWRRRDLDWTKVERQRWEVPAGYLVGKAFYIYWPHGVPMWPKFRVTLGGREVLLPFRPYFERMRWIR